jgi:phosphatidylserine/phosphatidylglycerophosphate/cardiolipin synthase-like enzyme
MAPTQATIGRGAHRPADDVVVAQEDRRNAVLRVIGAARERLILSVFRCDDLEVLDGLADALRRKVRVEILITGRAKGWQQRLQRLWVLLEGMGATLHRYADPVVKYHAKYIVADDGPALVASLNLTRKCFSSTVDFVVTTYDPNVVSGLKRLFDADCQKPGATAPRGLSKRLIIGPEDARSRFTALIDGARRSIMLIDPEATDPGILARLKARAADGVEVSLSKCGNLAGMTPHGKLLVIDGTTAVIGSLSLSALSLDFRREVAIVVDDARCVRPLNALFGAAGNPASRRPTRSRKSARS